MPNPHPRPLWRLYGPPRRPLPEDPGAYLPKVCIARCFNEAEAQRIAQHYAEFHFDTTPRWERDGRSRGILRAALEGRAAHPRMGLELRAP